MQKKASGWLIFLILVLGIVAGASIRELLKSPRDKYGAIDFKSNSWRAEFISEYQQAIENEDLWVKDVETVALRIAGYPNADKIPPERVEVETAQAGKVIVTILSRRLMDDSIARQETRVELVKNGDVWRIEWAGLRQQCYRGFGFGWTTSLCP